jgi:hypothetical protein
MAFETIDISAGTGGGADEQFSAVVTLAANEVAQLRVETLGGSPVAWFEFDANGVVTNHQIGEGHLATSRAAHCPAIGPGDVRVGVRRNGTHGALAGILEGI